MLDTRFFTPYSSYCATSWLGSTTLFVQDPSERNQVGAQRQRADYTARRGNASRDEFRLTKLLARRHPHPSTLSPACSSLANAYVVRIVLSFYRCKGYNQKLYTSSLAAALLRESIWKHPPHNQGMAIPSTDISATSKTMTEIRT